MSGVFAQAYEHLTENEFYELAFKEIEKFTLEVKKERKTPNLLLPAKFNKSH